MQRKARSTFARSFTGLDGRGCVECLSRDVSANDIDAVEQRFVIDLIGLTREGQIGIRDRDVEVLGHLGPGFN
jgi:hypothetical protein